MATTANRGQKLVRKLTLREVVGSKSQILAIALTGRENDKAKEGDPVPVLRVVGNVTGYKPGESDYGSFVELRGQFKGTNLVTGEVLDNVAKCILPDVVGDMVAAALMGGAQSVQFMVEIDVLFDESAATMYRFEARSLLPPAPSDALAAIEALAGANKIEMTKPKQLAAPKLSDADAAKQAAASAAADATRKAKGEKGKETAKA